MTENESEKTKRILWFVIIVAVICIWSNYSEIKNLKEELNDCQDNLTDYKYALSDANYNIEEANSIIEDAQSYAWSSYEDMGYALENLSTVETISEP